MTDSTNKQDDPSTEASLHVAPSPHLCESWFNTRGMMIDVLVGLIPVMIMAVWVFQWYAVVQIGLCTLSCVLCEWMLNLFMGKKPAVGDYSAAVTGVILGMSLPAAAPWYVGVIASVVAIGLGKAAFGGLGHNLFNPAMVGRAFVMLSFASHLGASAYVVNDSTSVLSQATPLTIAKQFAADYAAGRVGDITPKILEPEQFWFLFIGQVNGSLGETSALALLVGGLFLCVRRAASWRIPAGVLLAGFVCAALVHNMHLTPFDALHHLISGSFLFGAFFIATDPVTSPLTPKGQFIFGLGIGLLTVLIRLFSGYPEGIMFAILLMNATVPLINRWTIPRPLGTT